MKWSNVQHALIWIAVILIIVCCAVFLVIAFTSPAQAQALVLPAPQPVAVGEGTKEPQPLPAPPSRPQVKPVEVKVKPAITKTPATPKPPAQPSYPKGSVQALIVKYWPGDDRKVLCVVNKETGGTFNPNIKSPGGTYWGLFQADSAFRAAYGFGWSIEQQVAMAWKGFQARGWQPWPTARGC